MAIIDLPRCWLITTRFDPIRPIAVSRTEGHRTERRIDLYPWWVATWVADTFRLDRMGIFDAFTMRLQDGDYLAAYDTTRPRPLEYIGGQPAGFSGVGAVTSIAPRQIGVSGFPAGYKFSVGDYVEVRKANGARSLHRVTAPVTLSGTGTGNLSILHPIDTQFFAVGDAVHVEYASCLMTVNAEEIEHMRRRGGRAQSFSAQEIFYNGES